MPLLLELDKLKSIYRKSYISDDDRRENSAEHSWHLAMALMSFKSFLPEDLNIDHAIRMALAHDVCEVGAGDVCAYNAHHAEKAEKEQAYLESLAKRHPEFGEEMLMLWHEYEYQQTAESQWVKVMDKLLPFLLNLATEGRTWQEQQITAPMVRRHNESICQVSPDIYAWMMKELDSAVAQGWLPESSASQ